MSYYSQQNNNQYGSAGGSIPNTAPGLQFLPSQFEISTRNANNNNTATAYPTAAGSGTMGNKGFFGTNKNPTSFSASPSASTINPAFSFSGQQQQERLSTGFLAAFGTSGYPGEPPLLEELGFNFTHIKQKTLIVLNPSATVDQNIMADSDLAGPIFFCLLFGTFLLLSGKVHFGYIYGSAIVGTISQYVILNLMSSYKSIDLTRVASVLGYCMLPLVFISAIGVVVSMDNIVGYVLSALSIIWCTKSASAIFVSVLQLSDMTMLVAYPLALFYGVFSIMTIFAEDVVNN